MATPAERRPMRRLMTISLRTTLILVAAIGIGLAWYTKRAKEQKEVAEWVQSFGRRPYYSFEFDSKGDFLKNPIPPGPTSLRKLLGVDFFSSIQLLHLDDRPVKDISLVARLKNLRHFELSSGQISDITPLTYFMSPASESGGLEPFRTQDKRFCGFLFLRTLRTGSRALSLEHGSLLDSLGIAVVDAENYCRRDGAIDEEGYFFLASR